MWAQMFRSLNFSRQWQGHHSAVAMDIFLKFPRFSSRRLSSSTLKQDKEKKVNVEEEENEIATGVAVMTNDKSDTMSSALKTISVVPGKGSPPEPPVTCCMSGCSNCVWISYAEELKEYYGDGGAQALKALDQIEDPSLKAFIKLELGL